MGETGEAWGTGEACSFLKKGTEKLFLRGDFFVVG